MEESWGVLLAYLIPLAIIGYILYVYYKKRKLMYEESEAWDSINFDTISYEDLINLRQKTEKEFEEKKNCTNIFYKMTPTELYNEERLKDFKLLHIRAVINKRFSDVITTREELKSRAHSLATYSEKTRLQSLEKELETARKRYASSYGSGPQYLENTQSSVINGIVGSKVGGPVVGGLAYAATESKNKEIEKRNLESRVHNAILNNSYDELKRIEKRLDEEYIDIVKTHDKNVHIELFKKVHLKNYSV